MSAQATPIVHPPSRRKRWLTRLTLAVVIVGLVAILATIYVQHVILQLRIEFARDQVEIFEMMRVQVSEKEPAEAADSLNYVVVYYPSGSKQVAGSKLDKIVESARASAIREIIADLRSRTGRDYGDDPQTWIENLRKPQPE